MSCGFGTRIISGGFIYRLDPDAVIIAEVFSKKTNTTPKEVIRNSKARLRRYDEA